MDRAHVEMDNGTVADINVREFTVEQTLYSAAEVRIEGVLTQLTERKLQAQELTVEDVIYHDPATVVYWGDKTRTVVKCQPGDTYDPETGFLLALCKKVCGNTGNYNNLLRKYIPGYGNGKSRIKPSNEKNQIEPSIDQMRWELSHFCRNRSCCNCPMRGNSFECGRGKFFDAPEGDSGYMTDESIVRHYRVMKGAKP